MPKSNASPHRIRDHLKYASRIHYNNFLTYGSQKLIVMYTKTPMLGGVVLPSMVMKSAAYEKAFAIWANSTLGIISHWLISGRQQRGRSIIRLKHALTVPCLDLTKLGSGITGTTNKKLYQMSNLFDSLQSKNLRPIRYLYSDPVRAELDRQLLQILELNIDLSDIRWRFSSEPHVHCGDSPSKDKLV